MAADDVYTPYPFTQRELDPQHLGPGIDVALRSFEAWRDTHPETIAEHVDALTGAIDTVAADYTLRRRIGRLVVPTRRQCFDAKNEHEWVTYFGLHNLGEALDDDAVDYLCARLHCARELVDAQQTHREAKRDILGTVFRSVEELAPELRNLPEMGWLESRVERLHRILPENVIQAGGIGKVMRTIMGVLAIAVYDMRHEPLATRTAHLKQVIPGAYVLGSTYAIVDDTMQSRAGKAISVADKEKIHEQLAHGLATGETLDPTWCPEHPLAEELQYVCKLLTDMFPFDEYRHLYHSIEAMYLAQRRDAQLTPEIVAANGGVRSMYHDMAIKAAMTRVVANILGRQTVPQDVYRRILNSVFISQLKDDFQDRFIDMAAGDCTPFSLSPTIATDGTNPLYDLFAFSAYRANVIWGDHPHAAQALVRYDPSEIAPYIAANPKQALDTLNRYPHSQEIDRFVLRAVGLSPQQARRVMPRDMQLESAVSNRTRIRDQQSIDPRTFVNDRLPFLNTTVREAITGSGLLEEVTAYSLSAGGKRLRPALTLMLAESLGVPYGQVAPLIQTIELTHISSLILDGLPAQDNALRRRGRPTAHIAYPEWAAQLASVAMISRGFGVLTNLQEHFPPDRVNDVIRYADQILGFGGLCEGQTMDLAMNSQIKDIDEAKVIKMYTLKTSQAISAALVPLMLLLGRPQAEIAHIETFATHAGIVFQLRDDILDLTASGEQLGKDANNDADKLNIARLYGLDEANHLMYRHLNAALDSCRQLPFETRLLESTVKFFACRKK